MDIQSRAAHDHDSDAPHGHAPDSAASLDKPFTDPVCGMKVGADQGKKIAHAGRDYFFCSLGCMAKFRSNPQSYLDKTT
ncbi:MAG: YHS domain-containing protein, partial [Pseudomonadota bacterium]|nr:YHS domain-containing protein [Pseudomonadota bacterium]